MRTLAIILKRPSETFKAFNDRLSEACSVLRPTTARMSVIDHQPKVTLIDTGQGVAMRAAVCPQHAQDDAAAEQTSQHLVRILNVANAPTANTLIESIDSADGRLCLLWWSLPKLDTVPTPNDAELNKPRRTSGRPLFGFRAGRDGHVGHEEHPEEGLIVRTILECLDADMTHDRIDRRLNEEHGDWLREHWNPRDRPKLIARIVERADWYRAHLPPEPPADAP